VEEVVDALVQARRIAARTARQLGRVAQDVPQARVQAKLHCGEEASGTSRGEAAARVARRRAVDCAADYKVSASCRGRHVDSDSCGAATACRHGASGRSGGRSGEGASHRGQEGSNDTKSARSREVGEGEEGVVAAHLGGTAVAIEAARQVEVLHEAQDGTLRSNGA